MKRKKAAAIKYTKDLSVPIITAMGVGQIADKIIEKANLNEIPVVTNENLIDEISKLPVGAEIPPELYEVVAEIIAFVYSINDKI